MTYTDIVLIAVVWAVVGLAVAVWRLRRDVAAWDDDLETESDLRRSLNRRHVELMARVEDLDDMATRTAHSLISTEANLKLDIHELEDSRSRTADVDVPTIHRPVPADFNRNR